MQLTTIKFKMDTRRRCSWVTDHELYINYHDEEWGVPELDDRALFEKLCLDGAQAGVSWFVILKKREHYQRVFDNFNAERIIDYTDAEMEEKLQDPGIIRNRLKVYSVRTNAEAYLKIKAKYSSFSDYLWSFTNGKTIINAWDDLADCPAKTKESEAMSKALKKEGFKFVGPTICYAFMQAVGMVNDHATYCFRYEECLALARK